MINRASNGPRLEKSRFGNPLPTYRLEACAETGKRGERAITAALYDLAARIERATPAGENWTVTINRDFCAVCIEVDTSHEAERAMDVLRRVHDGAGR